MAMAMPTFNEDRTRRDTTRVPWRTGLLPRAPRFRRAAPDRARFDTLRRASFQAATRIHEAFVGAAATIAVIPFTLIVMLPINNRILEPGRDKTSVETRTLLERWGRLHAVRTIVSLVASGLFVVA